MTQNVTAGQALTLVLNATVITGGAPADPDTLSLSVLAPDGSTAIGPISTAAMDHPVVGTYIWRGTTASSMASGVYVAVWSATFSGSPRTATEIVNVAAAAVASDAYAIGVTTQQQTIPYLSLDEFKYHRRRGVDTSRLATNGVAADNDAALAQILYDASHRANTYCLQVLQATQDTVLDQVNVSRDGYAKVHPRYRPIIAVTAVSMGSAPSMLYPLANLSSIGVELNKFSVPVGPITPLTTSQGPLQFGGVRAPQDQAWIQYTIVNGFPHMFLTEAGDVGATELAVSDTTGIIEGRTRLTLYAGRNRISFTAGAVSTAVNGLGFGPGTVGCPALPYAVASRDQYPTMVSALPGDFLDAVANIARAMIKEASLANIAATTTSGSVQKSKDPLGAGDDMANAERVLSDYMAVVE